MDDPAQELGRRIGAMDNTANAALQAVFALTRRLAEAGTISADDVQYVAGWATGGLDPAAPGVRNLTAHIANLRDEILAAIPD